MGNTRAGARTPAPTRRFSRQTLLTPSGQQTKINLGRKLGLAVNASASGPVLVAVDDLHWADQASVRFLLYLADRLAGLPIALALSWRVAEAQDGADPLARLEQIAAGSVVSLAPLSPRSVRALLTDEFGTAPAERFAAACHAVTGGNAFLLRELTQQLRADEIGPSEEAAAQVTALGPRSVARAVALRVARLGPAAGELARAAAVLGDGAELRHAAALAGMGLADAAAAADGLAGIGVFEPGTPLRFAHPIVRTAVHEDIPQADRGLRHAEAARLLAAEGADLDAVCAHLLVCEPAGSPEVVERLRAAAARAVVRGAPESAAAYLRRAVAETADVSLRAVLSHELGRAEKVLGDPSAAEHLREALRLTGDPAERAAVAPDLGELLVLAGSGMPAQRSSGRHSRNWRTVTSSSARPPLPQLPACRRGGRGCRRTTPAWWMSLTIAWASCAPRPADRMSRRACWLDCSRASSPFGVNRGPRCWRCSITHSPAAAFWPGSTLIP